MSQTRGAKQFWAVADQFRQVGQTWMPTNAGYEVRRAVKADGKAWTICLKVHVVSDDGGTNRGSTRLLFKSSVTFWPPDLNKSEQQRLVKLGWYKTSAQELARMGYHGKWSKSPYGMWGDFWKDLTSVADVRREAKQLEKLRLGIPTSSS